MGWLLVIGALQLAVLIYIAYRIEALASASVMGRMLDAVIAEIRAVAQRPS